MKLIPISLEGNRQIDGGWLFLFVLVLSAYARPHLIEAGAKTEIHRDESAPVLAEAWGTYHVAVRSGPNAPANGTYEAKLGRRGRPPEQDRNRIAAQAVFAEAEQLRAKGDLESLQSAIKKYQEALSLYRSLGNQDGEANALGKLGEVCFNTGENKGALDYSSQELRSGERLVIAAARLTHFSTSVWFPMIWDRNNKRWTTSIKRYCSAGVLVIALKSPMCLTISAGSIPQCGNRRKR